VTDKPNVGIWIHVRDIVVQILRVRIVQLREEARTVPTVE
jgi:hypothetical protein